MNYETLLLEADALGLIVKEVNLITRKGRCFGNRIAIDINITTDAEKACILREEIEHYNTTVGDITDQTKLINRKQEHLARSIAIEKLCSLEKIVKAIKNGAVDRYEVAEFLNITNVFFDEAVEYHRRKHGICCESNGVLIYFEPCFGILRNDIF